MQAHKEKSKFITVLYFICIALFIVNIYLDAKGEGIKSIERGAWLFLVLASIAQLILPKFKKKTKE